MNSRNLIVSTIRLMTLLAVLVLVSRASPRHSPPRDYTIDWPIKSYGSGTRAFDPRAYYASLFKVTKRTAEPLYLPNVIDTKSDVKQQHPGLQLRENDDFSDADLDRQILPFSSFITLLL